MSKNSVIDREEYWQRVRFVAGLYEIQRNARKDIENLNIMTYLADNFDVDLEDLYKWITCDELAGELQNNKINFKTN